MATANNSALQVILRCELMEWNSRYREKFGFVFIICASGRGTPEILAELKKRYLNRPIVELEMGAQEEMKIIELRLARLFNSDAGSNIPVTTGLPVSSPTKPEGNSHSTRPPITTHVLDVACGSPASGMEVHLEMWKGTQQYPSFTNRESTDWMLIGSSITNTDGRSGPLMGIAKHITPGFYRISFNTGKYAPSGFFPYVSLVYFSECYFFLRMGSVYARIRLPPLPSFSLASSLLKHLLPHQPRPPLCYTATATTLDLRKPAPPPLPRSRIAIVAF
ncbi:hypothetical protein BHE74_00009558 [Ensete ventricosum]|nr:hypothetical protein BHE74_00009558 [Ensete ventricosum]